jgi:hypothetical protein
MACVQADSVVTMSEPCACPMPQGTSPIFPVSWVSLRHPKQDVGLFGGPRSVNKRVRCEQVFSGKFKADVPEACFYRSSITKTYLIFQQTNAMGAWGHGNLENDGAQDLLAGMCDDFFRRVLEILKSKNGHEYDELAHDELFLLCEMLFGMHDRGMVNSSPAASELEPLITPFIERWADYHRRAGNELPKQRQAVMEETFQKLLSISEQACQGSFAHRLGLIAEVMGKR